jgi:myo-inositol-1(or 4)-monophosphatase
MIVILINNPLRENNNELLIELLRFLFIIVSTVNKIDVMKNFNADLNVVLEAVRKASVKITKDFYEVEKLQISKKGVANFVTKTDLTAEKILIYHLQKSRPEYSFITEESGILESIKNDNSDQTKYKWIIDPIDGTFNFMHGVPFFCISVALAKITKDESSILLGVVCNPVNNEIFWAGKNMGAFLIDSMGIQRKIKVSAHNDYERVICAIHDDSNRNATIKKYLNFIHLKHSKIRIFGASALEMAYLADGRINLLIQGKLHLWDYAAGLILIREAGGVVRDLNGKDLELNIYEGVIAGNDRLVSEIEKSS